MSDAHSGDFATLRPTPADHAKKLARDYSERLPSSVSGQRRRPVWPSDPRVARLISPPGSTNADSGTVSGGGQYTSGTGLANGRPVGPTCRTLSATGPGFHIPIGSGGYAWWYLDAISDDARWRLCIIAFLGSVFSPYYASARRRGAAQPLNHCAFNIVLSGPANRWCMTERPLGRVQIKPEMLCIGPSSLSWDGREFVFELTERCAPLPLAVRGTVRVRPSPQTQVVYALDSNAHHVWLPLAPRARVEVRLQEPASHWCGDAYLDSNRGERALERDFHGWHWSRAATHEATTIFYDTLARHEASAPLAVLFSSSDETPRSVPVPQRVTLPPSAWGIARMARSDDAGATQLIDTLVDAPFYARSLLRTQLNSESVLTVHESLDLDRFSSAWVRCLLPFRMPRWRGGQCIDPLRSDAN